MNKSAQRPYKSLKKICDLRFMRSEHSGYASFILCTAVFLLYSRGSKVIKTCWKKIKEKPENKSLICGGVSIFLPDGLPLSQVKQGEEYVSVFSYAVVGEALQVDQ